MTDLSKFAEILELPPTDRLALVAAIWDSLAQTPENVPVPEWHRELLRERLANDDVDPEPGESFAELRRRLEGRA